jgi:hypothetical protein
MRVVDAGGGILAEDFESKDAADLIDVCIRVSGDVKVPLLLLLLLLLLLMAVTIALIVCISPYTPHTTLPPPPAAAGAPSQPDARRQAQGIVRSGLQITNVDNICKSHAFTTCCSA